MKRQIRGEIAWQRLQRRQIEPFVTVGDDEVQAVIARLERAARHRRISGRRDLHLRDARNRGRGAGQCRADRPADPRRRLLRGLCPPISPKRRPPRVGGDLGWVRAEQLPDELAALVRQMPVGAISDPIPVPGGYSIVALVDTRQVLVADPRDARAQPDADVGRAARRARRRRRRGARPAARPRPPRRWAAAAAPPATAQRLGAELISNDQVRVRELPPPLQQMLLSLSVGQATPPFGSPERISVLVLCGRDDPPAATAPELRRRSIDSMQRAAGRTAARSVTCATSGGTR